MMKLKPCPFCGCKKIRVGVVPPIVKCCRCGVEIIRKSTKSAIEAWNKRS